jgi:hypothetical protein
VVDFLESLSSTQFKRIADWFQSMPTVADVVEYSCMACGKKQELELRGIQSFFT